MSNFNSSAAGLPLGGTLQEPLNRFHHMIEILVSYCIRFSVTPSVDTSNPLTRPSFYSSNNWTNKSSGLSNSDQFRTRRVFVMDPPIHIFIEKFCRGFYHEPPRLGALTALKDRRQNLPDGTGHVWDATGKFEMLNSSFNGFDYINLQLTRVHSDLLKQEIDNFMRTGLLPRVKRTAENGNTKCPVINDDEGDRLLLSEDVPIFIERLKKRQERRRTWEKNTWRSSSYDQENATPHHHPNTVSQMIGSYPLDEYSYLFDVEFRSRRVVTFHFDSGDAKAVRYFPTFDELFK